MDIKASDVKALREKTSASMMECKKALAETNGDAKAAAKLLKEKGLAAVEKRASRATSEGRVFIAVKSDKALLCEVTCETDFVAKNDDFIKIGNEIAEKALAKGYTDVNDELSGVLLDLATRVRENMMLRRIRAIDIPPGSVASKYIHTDGKIGVVVVLSVEPPEKASDTAITEFAFDCCLHIAAYTPRYNTRNDVDSAYLAEQKEIFAKQVADLDKPDKVKESIADGKLNKHFSDVCFMEQPFVKDDKVSVAKKMAEIGSKIGAKIALVNATLFQLGL